MVSFSFSLQEYSVQLTFREQWLDERLKFDDFGGNYRLRNSRMIPSLPARLATPLPRISPNCSLKFFMCNFTGRLKYLTLTDASRVWMPDLFFSNEKEGHFHNIIMPNVYIRIFPKGSVLYSIR